MAKQASVALHLSAQSELLPLTLEPKGGWWKGEAIAAQGGIGISWSHRGDLFVRGQAPGNRKRGESRQAWPWETRLSLRVTQDTEGIMGNSQGRVKMKNSLLAYTFPIIPDCIEVIGWKWKGLPPWSNGRQNLGPGLIAFCALWLQTHPLIYIPGGQIDTDHSQVDRKSLDCLWIVGVIYTGGDNSMQLIPEQINQMAKTKSYLQSFW